MLNAYPMSQLFFWLLPEDTVRLSSSRRSRSMEVGLLGCEGCPARAPRPGGTASRG